MTPAPAGTPMLVSSPAAQPVIFAEPVDDRSTPLSILNAALAAEIRGLLRCKRCYYAAEGNDHKLRDEFLEHAVVRSMHADTIAERITELGGVPDFTPAISEEQTATSQLGAAVIDDLAQLIVDVENGREMLRKLGGADLRTRTLLEEIVARIQGWARRLPRLLEELRQPV